MYYYYYNDTKVHCNRRKEGKKKFDSNERRGRREKYLD